MKDGWYVVTGATGGIGHALARGLVDRGLPVVLVCRNGAAGAALKRSLEAAVPSARVALVVADLSSLAGMRSAAAGIREAAPRVAALIHNAGVWPTRRVLTEDGLELAFAVNHLAPFVVTCLLLPHLMASAPCRVVNVNAGLYVFGRFDPALTPTGAQFSALSTYADSKLCNLLFSLELARRLPESAGVTVNALHPGVIRTALGDRPGVAGWLLRQVKRLWKSPEAGAAPVIRLATDPALAGVTGRFYMELEPKAVHQKAVDVALAGALWRRSSELAGFPPGADTDGTPASLEEKMYE